ncbi:MAG: ferredoxin [Kiritimatiellia bacterium]|nr:ferredoxin [Kiritimatiellia bacterium]
MKAIVDADTCTGCELCVDTCPEVFVLQGDVAGVKTTVVPTESEAACQEAADSCPVEAIKIEA